MTPAEVVGAITPLGLLLGLLVVVKTRRTRLSRQERIAKAVLTLDVPYFYAKDLAKRLNLPCPFVIRCLGRMVRNGVLVEEWETSMPDGAPRRRRYHPARDLWEQPHQAREMQGAPNVH